MRVVLGTVAAVALLPASAQAAELVVTEPTGVPQEVKVERGGTARFEIDVTATGNVSCLTRRESGVSATVPTRFAIGTGGVTPSEPSRALPFYSNGQGLFSCGVAWDDSPKPYRVIGTVTAADDAPLGGQDLDLRAAVTNPGLAFLGPLRDDNVSSVSIEVIEPLPLAKENESVNLLPISGRTYFTLPGGRPTLITGPIHLAIGAMVDTRFGHIDLVSDSDGNQAQQRGEFWAGRFRVRYSRRTTPGRSGASQRATRPFTELRVLGGVPNRCGPTGARASKEDAQTSRRRKRRRLWGRGRGRYRTRGRRGAATVRGTTWLTQNSCRGTLFKVPNGTLTVRDFGLDRSIRVSAPGRYLAAPPGATDGHG